MKGSFQVIELAPGIYFAGFNNEEKALIVPDPFQAAQVDKWLDMKRKSFFKTLQLAYASARFVTIEYDWRVSHESSKEG